MSGRAAASARLFKRVKKAPPPQRWRFKIVRGDQVQLLSGKDKTKQGEVIKVVPKKNAVLVQGLNLSTRNARSQGETKGGTYKKEALVDVSNVALLDPVDGKPTRVRFGYLSDGTKTRVAVRSGHSIPKPNLYIRKQRETGPYDTEPEVAHEVTYVPEVLTTESPFYAQMVRALEVEEKAQELRRLQKLGYNMKKVRLERLAREKEEAAAAYGGSGQEQAAAA